MKAIAPRTLLIAVLSLSLLGGCTAHCTCPTQPQPTTTTIITPHD